MRQKKLHIKANLVLLCTPSSSILIDLLNSILIDLEVKLL